MNKNILITFALIITVMVNGQDKLNNYKYVVIPSRYDFQKTTNEHNINRLLQMKFQQMGFETYLDTDELPKELKTNTCSYLKPVVMHNSTLFKTNIKVHVEDCDKNILFETQEGVSRAKKYKLSYNEALREALQSFGNYRLQYKKNEIAEVEVETSINIVKPVLSEPVKTNISSNYQLNDVTYLFQIDDKHKNIKNIVIVSSSNSVGLIRNTAKKGVYHVVFKGKKGIGYFNKNGDFTVEYLYEGSSVIKQVFEKQ